MKDELRKTKLAYPCDEMLLEAPSPYKQPKDASSRGASYRSIRVKKNVKSGEHDDAESSAAISTISQVIARKQEKQDEVSEGSVYGP